MQTSCCTRETVITTILSKQRLVNLKRKLLLVLLFVIAKDGKIDIEGIVDEEIEIIKSIPNFDFNIPVLGNGNISNGNITISIPFINKGIMFNQSDLETFRQLLTK